MEKKICRLMAVMDYLNGGIKIDAFSERLKLQKYIYLVQQVAIDLGYRHSWYVHGPYSPDLTETAYQYVASKSYYDKIYKKQKYGVSTTGKEKLDIINRLLKNIPGLDETSWLELLASIHYLKKFAFSNDKGEISNDEVHEKLQAYGKDQFKRDIVSKACEALKSENLIN